MEFSTNEVRIVPLHTNGDVLTEVIRQGAKQLLSQAVEAEVADWIERHKPERDPQGRQQVVRNGFLPPRTILTGIGPVDVKQPRVHDRRGHEQAEKFTSQILPPYLRKTKSIEELIPWLYLKGISTGDFDEALAAILGPQAKGFTTVKAVQQPRALATREKILKAAARLFALKGYHDTKLEEVRHAAEVTTGAFFHHFGSKEDLGFAVLDRHMERRRQELEQIEQEMPPPRDDAPLERVYRRLDAIAELVRRREHRKGGCIIGNLSTALADTHEAFRRRLAKCFDEMAREFLPDLEAAARQGCPQGTLDTWTLARYLVTVIEGAIMLARTYRDRTLLAQHFGCLKEYLAQNLGS